MADEMDVAQPEMDISNALKEVLKKALVADGLRRGLHESVKALDSRTAMLCLLAKDCDNDEYVRLVEALCKEGNIPLLMAETGAELCEWAGLAKLNPDATVKKAVKCSVAVVTDFGESSPALTFVNNYVKSQQ